MVFNAVVNCISVISRWPVHYPCFPEVVLTSTPHNILSKPPAAFPHKQPRNNDIGETGMNPVAMTMIDHRKEYWPSLGSNQRPPILKSARLPIVLWGSPRIKVHNPLPYNSGF